MKEKEPTPLQASFWLTKQEQGYILVVCAVFLVGIAARYFYLKTETPEAYAPGGVEEPEKSHE